MFRLQLASLSLFLHWTLHGKVRISRQIYREYHLVRINFISSLVLVKDNKKPSCRTHAYAFYPSIGILFPQFIQISASKNTHRQYYNSEIPLQDGTRRFSPSIAQIIADNNLFPYQRNAKGKVSSFYNINSTRYSYLNIWI